MLQINFEKKEFNLDGSDAGLNAIADTVYRDASRLILWSLTKWQQITASGNMQVNFVKDGSLPLQSYLVTCVALNAYEIRWNGLPAPRQDIHYNYAAFAGAALCEKIHGAVMVMPGKTGLQVNVNPPAFLAIGSSFSYFSNFKFNCWSNINVSNDEKTFFLWHHIPSEGINNTSLRGRYSEQFIPFLPNIGQQFIVKQFTVYLSDSSKTGPDPLAAITVYCEFFRIGEPLFEDYILNFYFKPPSISLYLKALSGKFYPFTVSPSGVINSFPAIVPEKAPELPANFPYTPVISYRCPHSHASYSDNWANAFPIMSDTTYSGTPFPAKQKLDLFKEYESPDALNIVADAIYLQWMIQGRPDNVNLFEQDGTNFRYIIPLFFSGIPQKYKAVEIGGVIYDLTKDPEFVSVISESIRFGAPAGLNFPWTGNPHKFKWWRENFYDLFEIQNNACLNARDFRFWLNMGSVTNDNSWQVNKIINTRFYLQWYKIVETMFIERCNESDFTIPRFRILAYSNYYTFPENITLDLSRFDVWFTIPAISDKSQGRYAFDIANWDRWQNTGATMIFRPSIFYSWRNLPFLDYYHWYPFLAHILPTIKGIIVDGFTPSNGSALQAMNIYALARGIRGVGRNECLNEFSGSFGTAKEAIKAFVSTINEATGKVVIYPQVKRANQMPLNWDLHKKLESDLISSGANLASPATSGDKYLFFCMYLWKQFLIYQDEIRIDERAVIKNAIIIWIREFIKNNPDCQCFSPSVDTTTRLISAYGVTIKNPDGTWLEDGLITHGFNVPLNTQRPNIYRTSPRDQDLKVFPGQWQSRDAMSYEYQWRRNGLNIAKANLRSYTLQPADVGTTIDCFVRVINKWGDYYAESNGVLVKPGDISVEKREILSKPIDSLLKKIGVLFGRR